MENDVIQFGVLGCGGFGLFALQHFTQVPGPRLAAMAGTHRQAALAAAKRFGIPNLDDVEALLGYPDLKLIYIATPPFLHYVQAMAAIKAGKHVICEKPLALTLAQADEMIAAARDYPGGPRLLVANLMQRYSPLFDQVGQLIRSGVLGEVLHGFFENYATDEGLPPDHWFWDRSRSGGLFIEHGVHFFDLLAGWLGPGTVVSAQRGRRPGSDIEEHVQCAVRYGSNILFQFYHGFHQPARMDRQELRLVFERGDLSLYGWIPCAGRIHAVVDEEQTRRLCEIFPGARLDVTATYGGKERSCSGRHKDLDVYQKIELTFGAGEEKLHRYGALLRSFLADQVAWLRNPSHPRRVTEENGRASLAAAVEATRLADGEFQR